MQCNKNSETVVKRARAHKVASNSKGKEQGPKSRVPTERESEADIEMEHHVENSVDDLEKSIEKEQEDMDIEQSCFSELTVSDYVAAIYEKVWYVGKVEEIDIDDRDCLVNFMHKAKTLFKWHIPQTNYESKRMI